MTTPIKISELEKEIEYQDEIGTGMDCRDSYCMEIKPPDLSRLCEAIRIAHGELKSIKLTGYSDHVKLRQIADKALTKINSLVDLS